MRSADIRLSAAAERDIIETLRISLEDFGRDGALRYQHLIATALEDLATDSSRNGVVRRPELAADVYTYHLRHSRERARHPSRIVRRPRHFLLFKQLAPSLLGIGRLLHDSMEIERHLPKDFGGA